MTRKFRWQRPKRVRKQRSIWYFLPQPDAAEQVFFRQEAQLYVSMFLQDLPLHVMPVWINRGDSKLDVRIEPENAETEALLASAFDVGTDPGYYHELGHPLRKFISQVTRELCTYSEAPFEIASVFEEDGEKPAGFELVQLNPAQIKHRWGKWTPNGSAGNRGGAKGRRIHLATQ